MAKKASSPLLSPQKNTLTNYFARASASPSPSMTHIPDDDDDTIRVAHRTRPISIQLPSPTKHDAKRRRLDGPDAHADAQSSSLTRGSLKTANPDSAEHIRSEPSSSLTHQAHANSKLGQSFTSDVPLSSAPSQISVPSRFGPRSSWTPGSSSEIPVVVGSSDSDEDSLTLDDTPRPLDLTKTQGQDSHHRTSLLPSERSDDDTAADCSSNSSREAAGDYDDRLQTTISSAQLTTSSSEDSGSDLEDLSSIFKIRKQPQNDPSAAISGPNTPAGRVLRSAGAARVSGSSTRRRPVYQQALQPSNEFSLSALVKQSNRDAQIDAQIAKAKSFLQQSTPDQHSASTLKSALPDEDLVASVYEGKEDRDIQKVLQAIQRTNAKHVDTVWTFFEEQADLATTKLNVTWPRLRKPSWILKFNDSQNREEAFRSGFMAEFFRSPETLADVYSYTFAALLHESDEQLQLAYENALEIPSASANAVITEAFLQQTLTFLGARTTAVDMTLKIVPTRTSNTYTLQPLRMRRLSSVLRVLAGVAPCLSTVSRHYAILALTRLCTDNGIVQISHAYVELVRALSRLVDTMSDVSVDQEIAIIVRDISTGISNRLLQSQLLQALPGVSRRCAYIKQQLALSFIFQDDSTVSRGIQDDNAEADMRLHSRILDFLTKLAADSTNSDTDYLHLAATVSVLDFGIGDSYGRPKQRAELEKDDTSGIEIQREKQAEADFNARVDAITKKTRYMSARIVDGGTSLLLRTEAKATLERLTFRLEHTVRTKLRPRKPIFGMDKRSTKFMADAGAAQMGQMERFLKPAADDKEPTASPAAHV